MLRNLFRWPRLAAAGLALSALLALIACGADPTATPLPTATTAPPTATAPPAPTATPPPTATPVPPTATPAPTATAVPPTATPVPPMGMMQPGQSLMPEGAQFIIDLRPQALMDSPFLEEMAAMLEIDSESLIDDAVEVTCLEPESVDYLQMYLPADLFADFADLTDLAMDPDAADDAMDAMWDDLPDFGVALYGGFDQAEVMPCLAASPDAAAYEMSEHRGYDVYTSDADGTSLAFAAANVMLMGTPAGLEAMLDVAAGAAPAASGPVVDALESLGPRHLGFSQETPPGLMDSAMDLMPEQGLLGALDFSALNAPVNATGILLGDGIEVVSVSVYDDPAAANAAKEYTEGLLAMTGMMFAEAPPELAQLTSGLEVSQDGSSVTTRIAITAATIEMLMELLDSGMMMPSDN